VPRLEWVQVLKIYDGWGSPQGKTALYPFSLQVEAGESLGIIGESGAGKSTLARIVAGLEHPTSGIVRFEGRLISGLKGRERQALKKEIQMIGQDPHSFLNPYLRVQQLIAEPLEVFHIVSRSRRKEKVRELAGLVGLEEGLLEKKPGRLSGGQAQRVAIARALVLTPKILICDEILSSLDSLRQVQILELLKTLKHKLDLTLLFISHDLSAVAYLCENIAVFHEGRLVELSPTAEFLRRPRHPYSRRFLEAARRTLLS
jgi:ABC-type glutathione transport system ATPase component